MANKPRTALPVIFCRKCKTTHAPGADCPKVAARAVKSVAEVELDRLRQANRERVAAHKAGLTVAQYRERQKT